MNGYDVYVGRRLKEPVNPPADPERRGTRTFDVGQWYFYGWHIQSLPLEIDIIKIGSPRQNYEILHPKIPPYILNALTNKILNSVNTVIHVIPPLVIPYHI